MSDSKSEIGTRIETTYEPGWGSTGPTTLEDAVMIDQPVGIYGIKEDRAREYQEALNKETGGDIPRDLILFAESEATSTRYGQAEVALKYANRILMDQESFPKVAGLIKGTSLSPVTIGMLPEDQFHYTSPETHTKIGLGSILFAIKEGASDADYVIARSMVVNEANKTLQLFKADFRIPQFPTDKELPKI